MPNIKTDGEVMVDGESLNYWDTSSLGQVLRDIMGVNSKELGFGVEHKINDNLAIFGEYNINFFTVKINVPDADDFIDDVNNALVDAFGGVDGMDIDEWLGESKADELDLKNYTIKPFGETWVSKPNGSSTKTRKITDLLLRTPL
jgi:hypothetical protein